MLVSICFQHILYQEVDIKGLFDNWNYSEGDAKLEDLLEKTNIMNEEFGGLEREIEIQLVKICEVTNQKKKFEEDKFMTEKQKNGYQT